MIKYAPENQEFRLTSEIHVDERIPMASFDHRYEVHRAACWHGTNGQLLSKDDNFGKSASYRESDWLEFMAKFARGDEPIPRGQPRRFADGARRKYSYEVELDTQMKITQFFTPQ